MKAETIKVVDKTHAPPVDALQLYCRVVTSDDGCCVHPSNSLNQNNNRGAKIGARIKLQKRICGETEFVHTPIFK